MVSPSRPTLLTSLALTIALVASASAAPAPPTHDGAQVAQDAEALADDLLASLDGRTADLLLRVAQEGDITPTELAMDLSDPVGALQAAGVDLTLLPAELHGPVGRLWIATQAADDAVARATADLSASERALLFSEAPFASEPLAPATAAVPGVRTATVQAQPPAMTSDSLEVLVAKVDTARLVGAAHSLLQVVDAELPTLQRHASSALGGGTCDVGPDTHDEPGRLGIDSGTSTNWHQEYLLTIDLGGNDCYENSAGGGFGGASVAIDVLGNDRYRATSISGPIVAQGAGSVGVGILADAAGNDDYGATVTRTAPQPGPAAPTAVLSAQGGANLGGVGVLVDGGGSDVFQATGTSSGGVADVAAQGGARLAGVAVLATGGQAANGDDTTGYHVEARSFLHLAFQDQTSSQYTKNAAVLMAQGGANLGGVAAHVDGLGSDSRTAVAHGDSAQTFAQGGAGGGVGILADGDGVDSYAAIAEGDVTLDLTVVDTRFCWTTNVNVNTADTRAVAQGGADVGSGILVDLGLDGAQTFHLQSTSFAKAHSEVRQSASSFCTNNAHATANTGDARAIGHGAAATGAGVLVAGANDDDYVTIGGSEAVAEALVNHGIVGANTASASSGAIDQLGQGATSIGAGVLLDAAGDDGYSRSAATSATETTSTGGTVPGTAGTITQRTEGWAQTGIGWLVDLGGTDTYSTPAAANDHCWTQPDAPAGYPHQGRGRDLGAGALPASCP